MLRRRSPAPAGFTLVELLIVVVIIAILLALLLPAIQKARIIAMETEARNEMSQFTIAAAAFEKDWGQYPPTTFTIPTRIDQPGYQLFKTRYPRWTPTLAADMVTLSPALPNAGVTLVGNQSMVYFLGGPEAINATVTAGNDVGWAHDRPFAPTTSTVSKKVYIEFNRSKLQPGNQYGYTSAANVHVDPFGNAYAYFGSNKVGGKYSNTAISTATPDIASTGSVQAYQESANKYLNENGCQIICAGPDNQFGPGGNSWSPTNASYVGSAAGGDDMANFNNGNRLGVK